MERNRRKNEREFDGWTESASGGRTYVRRVDASDGSGRFAEYIKEVDAEERTLSFMQKIYDPGGNCVEIHEKYPIDKGHVVLGALLILVFILLTLNGLTP